MALRLSERFAFRYSTGTRLEVMMYQLGDRVVITSESSVYYKEEGTIIRLAGDRSVYYRILLDCNPNYVGWDGSKGNIYLPKDFTFSASREPDWVL
jgi:hypothetical protein